MYIRSDSVCHDSTQRNSIKSRVILTREQPIRAWIPVSTYRYKFKAIYIIWDQAQCVDLGRVATYKCRLR